MKKPRSGLSARYLDALRAQLGRRQAVNSYMAQGLGRAAATRGLAVLDLALMHAEAMVTLAGTHDFGDTRSGLLKRAGVFFTQALVPLEDVQRATRNKNRHLQHRNETLRIHTAALAAGNRRLEREVGRRKAGEIAIRKGAEEFRTLFHESQAMQRKLTNLTRQVLYAQEEERKQISRELHDEVVQTLVGINVELSALLKGTSDGMHRLKAKIVRTQRLVEHSVNAVHRFARELRPAVLDDLGLIPALHAYTKRLALRKRMKIQLTAFAGVEALGGGKLTVLYRVAQEALTNVARHARATEVKIGITRIRAGIRMEIADNGQSFAVTKVVMAKNPKRLGLVGMRERMEMVGGTLTIDSAPGRGTTVRAELPFDTGKANK